MKLNNKTKIKIFVMIDNEIKKNNSIKNVSINIEKIYKNENFIETTIEDCDLCIFCVSNLKIETHQLILEKLYNKKIIFIFCGDLCCCFDRMILNLTNNISTICHTIYEDLNLIKLPTLNNSYRDFLVLKKTNSFHQNLKNININKINTFFNPIKFKNIDNSINIKKLADREIDICLLGSTQYNINTQTGKFITENKSKGLEIIENLKNKYKIITGRVSYTEYIKTIANSKIVISSQGWGEFSYKDYESLFYGCIVIKNCDYKIKSEPNIYDNIIYCNFNYDNIINIIDNLLQNINIYQDMIDNGRNKLLKVNEDEDKQINKISNHILNSFNKYEIDHTIYNNLFIYNEKILDKYNINNNDLELYFNDKINENEFHSFGFLPITDYFIYHKYRCFQNKRFKSFIKFISNQDKIRFYDGDNWNIITVKNNICEINYENDFSKYKKSRIGFFYKNNIKLIKIKQLDYKIQFI